MALLWRSLPTAPISRTSPARAALQQLYLRAMDTLEARPVPGTEGAVGPFFSPDGQWLGFFGGGKLKKVSVSGGAAVPLGDASFALGASWGDEGKIAFEPSSGSALQQVSSERGRYPAVADSSRERRDRTPMAGVLAGRQGRALWCLGGCGLRGRRPDDRDGRPADPDPRRHAAAVCALRTPGLCARGEPDSRAVRSPAAHRGGRGGARRRGGGAISQHRHCPVQHFHHGIAGLCAGGGFRRPKAGWCGSIATGQEKALPAPTRNYLYPGLSPDGKRVAVTIQDSEGYNIWVGDLARDKLDRRTFQANANYFGAWTGDGKQIAFGSTKEGSWNIFLQLADGSGGPDRLFTSENPQAPTSRSPDGLLALQVLNPTTGWDILVLGISDHTGAALPPGAR